jgi:NAD(P)-dependent dehydrogenase (short-subunit alcohol dehydrogenase family)
MVYSTPESMNQYSRHFQSSDGVTYHHAVYDLEHQNQVDDLIEHATSQYEKLDGLIYLAATGGTRTSLLKLTNDQIRKIFDVNVIAALMLLKGLAKTLSAAHGNAVFVGSQAAVTGGRLISTYASSKAALHQMVASVARELASINIRVNCVSPSIIDTPKMRRSNKISNELELNALAESIPSGRVGKPEEVAAAILWLLSNEESYVSGIVLPVSGAR